MSMTTASSTYFEQVAEQQMIERVRKLGSEAGLSQLEFRLGNAEAIPVEDGTVDVILSNEQRYS